jgi:hypothetical protein
MNRRLLVSYLTVTVAVLAVLAVLVVPLDPIFADHERDARTAPREPTSLTGRRPSAWRKRAVPDGLPHR